MIEAKNIIKNNKRYDFLLQIPKNGVCAELGVFQGKFASSILKRNNPKKLYLIDPYWKKYGDKFPWRKRFPFSPMEAFLVALERVKKYDKNKVATFVIDSDENFLNDIKDNFFDWVYLDSTHAYKDTLRELDIILPKIKLEGMICGHDFFPNPKNKHHGVAKAINEWLMHHEGHELYLRDNLSQWIIKRR
jgi:hypothetical protein